MPERWGDYRRMGTGKSSKKPTSILQLRYNCPTILRPLSVDVVFRGEHLAAAAHRRKGTMVQDYHFGPFRLDLGNARLWRSHEEVVLRPKSFAVLGYLVVRPGQLVTREEVLLATWPGVAVSDAVLTVCIGEKRPRDLSGHGPSNGVWVMKRRKP